MIRFTDSKMLLELATARGGPAERMAPQAAAVAYASRCNHMEYSGAYHVID
jgi:hypothetical protein